MRCLSNFKSDAKYLKKKESEIEINQTQYTVSSCKALTEILNKRIFIFSS
jgi:hypothetical protein